MKHSAKNFTVRSVLAVIAASTITLTSGCIRYRILDSNKEILRIQKSEQFVAPRDGYFVPDARMLEIGEALNREVLKLKPE